MKKIVSVILALFCIILCSCAPTVTEMPKYYTAELNGALVDAAPFIYYADFNVLYYAFLEHSVDADIFSEIVYNATVSDVLTYYAVVEEASARRLSLTDAEKAEVEKEYKDYLNSRQNEYLSEQDVRSCLTVFIIRNR